MKKYPNIAAYTTCPARLANVGRYPSGCLHGERPVIGLCIGIRVAIQRNNP